MKRHKIIKLTSFVYVILAINLFFLKPALAQSKAESKPNFIFILCDDLGFGDLNCYNNKGWKDMGCKGSRRIKTPNIDKIARQGLRLTNYYSNSPVSSLSRAAIMTGLFPSEIGFHGNLEDTKLNEQRGIPDYLSPDLPAITKILKSNGYVTGHFGKWHLGSTKDAPAPSVYGVDESATFMSSDPAFDSKQTDRSNWTAEITDRTIDFIEKNKDKAFYVNCWFLAPHELTPDKKQMEVYQNWDSMKPAHQKFSSVMQVYYSAITDIDSHIGRLLEKIDSSNLKENTVILFSSDNGPATIWSAKASYAGAGSTGPFRGCRGSLYDGGTRLPFIIRWPAKVPANVVDDISIVSAVDLMPTFCRIAEVKLPKDFKGDGQDMSDVFLGKTKKRVTPLMWEYRYDTFCRHMQKSPMLAMRQGNWKLLMNPDGSRIELYDVKNNLTEVDSLADRFPGVVEKMAEQLLKWHSQLPSLDKIPCRTGTSSYPWPRSGDLKKD